MVKEIASHLKQSPVKIGEAIMKVEDLLRKDKKFGNILRFVGKNLTKGRKRKYLISIE